MKQLAKHLLAVVVLAVLAFGFAGCEDDDGDPSIIVNHSSHTVTLEIQRGHYSSNRHWEILTLAPGMRWKIHEHFWYGAYTPSGRVIMITDRDRWSTWIEFHDRW